MRSPGLVLMALLWLGGAPAAAQPALAEGETDAPASVEEPATLTLFNRPIATLRSKFLGVSPGERARIAAQRFAERIANGDSGDVGVQDAPQGTIVTLDGAFLFIITTDDLSGAPDESTQRTATESAEVLRNVIEETRESRDFARMARASGEAAVVLVLCVLLVFWLARARGAMQRKVQARLERAAAERAAGALTSVGLGGAVAVLGWVMGAAVTFAALLVLYQTAVFVLGRFPYTRPWSEQLNQFLAELALGVVRGVVDALPGLTVAVVIFWLARLAVRAASGFFAAVQKQSLSLQWIDAESAPPTQRIVAAGIWLFALVMAYPYLPGADTEAFKGISVLVGIMVSMGGSSVVAHAGSGLILMYTRTFRSGEYVRIGDHEGTVAQVGTFNTRLRTGQGAEVVIPNALVIGSVTRNYSRLANGRGYALDTSVTIGYDTPWRQVEAMLTTAALRTDGISKTPAPMVFQPVLSDHYVEYRLVALAVPETPHTRAQALSMLHRNILDVFNEHGVQIMSPHYEGDPGEAKIVPPSQWYAAPAVAPDAATSEAKPAS